MAFETVEKTTETLSAAATCESCGGKFSCGARGGDCWCFKVELQVEILSNLAENHAGCLCAKCLTAMSENPSKL